MGSFKFERLSKYGEVCPICGHTDWCARMVPYDDMGVVLYNCQRAGAESFSQEPLTTFVSSYDGKTYVVISTKTSVTVQEIGGWMARNPGKHLKDGTVAPGGMSAPKYEPRKMVREEEVAVRPNDELHELYSAFLSLLVLEPSHREYLHSEGITDEEIEKYRIRSIPEPDGFRYQNRSYTSSNASRKQIMMRMAQKYGERLKGVPGFYRKNGEWTFNGQGGLAIPVPDIYGRFVGIRIRVDRRWKDDRGYTISQEQYQSEKKASAAENRPCRYRETGKYVWMSSYKEDEQKARQGIIANIYKDGCPSGIRLGYYQPSAAAKGNAQKAVIMTEGEKKGIVASDRLGMMCIDVPGVGNWRQMFDADRETGRRPVDVLKEAGVRLVIVAYDADKETNKHVLKAQDMLVDALKMEGIMVAVAGWDISVGKGLDDLLVAGGQPTYELL